MRSPETNSPSLVASNLGTKLGIFTLLAVTCMGMQPGLALAADAELSAAAPVYSVIDDARATTRDWSERLPAMSTAGSATRRSKTEATSRRVS